MDPALTVGLVSVATAIVTTGGGIAVAMITNRREAENAADDAVELTLRERLVLRSEQIEALRAENGALRAENEALRAENAALKAEGQP